jgi:hypothetical protein
VRDSLVGFVRNVRATVMVVSLGGGLFLAVVFTLIGWALRDGLFTHSVASHGREAWRRFLEAAAPMYLVCGVIALPGVLHWVLKRREARAAGPPGRWEAGGERTLVPGWRTLWTVCMCYGAAFGALCGVMCGITSPDPPVGLFYGAPAGLVVGSLAGCVYVAVGACVRGPAGWGLAGLLGSLAPTALIGFLLGRSPETGPLLTGLALVGLTGGCLGLAVAHGVDTGESRVPGMQSLVEIIQETTHAQRSRTASGIASEVAPSAAPAGRGDEAAPVGETVKAPDEVAPR